MLVKLFNGEGNVELKEMESTKGIESRVIRIIPEKMLNFSKKDKQYITITEKNINNLSEGDTVILTDKKGTYWHEIYLNDETKKLCLHGYSHQYESIEDILKSGKYISIQLRNDLYIPEYARA